jgi:ferrochelatase
MSTAPDAKRSKIGLLLVNLGSPEAPTPEALKPYLKEFLMDPEVIDIPAPLRWMLVNLLIVPRRSRDSAALYQKIWSDEGSPLLVNSRSFAAALGEELRNEDDLYISMGMRYGNPSILHALKQLPLTELTRLIVFPLYPQYAMSSTLTVQKKVREVLGSLPHATPEPEWISPFYGDPRYIDAVGDASAETFAQFDPDFSLFSFHGLPQRHLKRLHKVCLSEDHCCDRISDKNRNCYRAQCFATARSVAGVIGIPRERYSITFQSRLGRTPWIQPFTDHVIEDLPKQGVHRLAVFCPSFIADCLETLDGGKELRLIPSLNSHPTWVKAAGGMVRDTIGML